MRRLAGLGTLILLGFMTTQAWGQKSAAQGEGKRVPRLIRFSGTPRQVGVRPARGVAEKSLSLFKEESGGEPLWFETQTVEVDAQGRYNVLLGAMSDSKVGLRAPNAMVMASTGGTTPPAVITETSPATFTCTSASNCILATQNGTGHALAALSTAASGATFGVFGSSASSSGRCVLGQATSTAGHLRTPMAWRVVTISSFSSPATSSCGGASR